MGLLIIFILIVVIRKKYTANIPKKYFNFIFSRTKNKSETMNTEKRLSREIDQIKINSNHLRNNNQQNGDWLNIKLATINERQV